MGTGDPGVYGRPFREKYDGCSMECVFEAVREKLETKGETITMDDAWRTKKYITTLNNGYLARAQQLRNIMNVLVMMGHARKIDRGKWEIIIPMEPT